MGCQQSVPDDNLKMNVGKSERQPRIGRSDGATKQTSTTTMKRHSEVTLTASTSSRAAGSTVSLDVDEYITDEPPKIDSNGHLMPEEVVRRTSESISDSIIMLGDKRKHGKEVRLTVSTIIGGEPTFGKVTSICSESLKLTNHCGQFIISTPIDHSVVSIQMVSCVHVHA